MKPRSTLTACSRLAHFLGSSHNHLLGRKLDGSMLDTSLLCRNGITMLRRLLFRSVLLLTPPFSLLAQQFPPLQREPVLDAQVPAANPPIKLIHGARIRFAPGQPTGLHLHPVSTVGVVTEGSFLFEPEGEAVKTLKVGDSFFEPAGKTILRFDNASPSQSATIVVYYLTDSQKTPLIQLLKEKK